MSPNIVPAKDATGQAPTVKTDISFGQAVRDAGFESFGDFLASFQLKKNDDDIEVGMAILRGLFPEMNIVVN